MLPKIPDNEELGEKLIDICLVILGKAVKLTKTDMDDQLLKLLLRQSKHAKKKQNELNETLRWVSFFINIKGKQNYRKMALGYYRRR